MSARHWGTSRPTEEEYNDYVTLFGEDDYDETDESYACEISSIDPDDH